MLMLFLMHMCTRPGLSFAVSGMLNCRLWISQGGTAVDNSDGQMLGYKMDDCEHISEVITVIDRRLAVSAKWKLDLDLTLNAPLEFNLGANIASMVMFKHEINFGMYAAALRCQIRADFACSMEIHEFMVRACCAVGFDSHVWVVVHDQLHVVV